MVGAEGRERIAALDEPAEGKEGSSGENGGAPSVRVHSAVLPNGVSPLLPESSRVRVCWVGRVREVGLSARQDLFDLGCGFGLFRRGIEVCHFWGYASVLGFLLCP